MMQAFKGKGKGFGKGKGWGKGSQNNWGSKKGVWQSSWTKRNTSSTVPADFTVDGDKRFTGKVTAYSKFKGCGFVEMDEKGVVPGDKVFVYWKSILSDDRFPQLVKDMQVEFGLALRGGEGKEKDVQAKQVSQPGGARVFIQDEADSEKKEFVGGQELRYTGTLKFYDDWQ